MRGRAWALSVLSSTAVLTIGWQLGMHAHDVISTPAPAVTAASPAGETAPSASQTPSTAESPTASPAPSPTTAAPAAVSGTFVGDVATTRFGPVQVEITVKDGTITDVTALALTDNDPHSVSISNRAAPMLRDQVLRAQSAQVDGVSGATYTTDGYLTSLQSALDKAGL